LRIATRGSTLARWQAEDVARRLRVADPSCRPELVIVETAGDRRRDVPVWEMGGQGIFVKEVQIAVLEGRADIAVHSAKDLPSQTAQGLALASVPVRADPRDALVGSRLADLAAGATIATGSVRRRAQLAGLRPDLTFTSLRGNIATRLSRVPVGGAVVVAAAALERLGLVDRAAEILDVSVLLPQVGQGAIAVECRDGDRSTLEIMAAIDDPRAHTELRAERGFLARLGGGCDLPVGAFARLVPDSGEVEVEAMMASLDGRVLIRRSRRGSAGDAAGVGAGLAEEILHAGGDEL
jgi:hydroxymethylbilane synthase